MDLGDRGGADRFGIDLAIDLAERPPEPLLDRRPDRLERCGRQAVLEQREIVRRLLADQIGAGRQRLAKLDRGRADRLEGLGISGDVGNTRAEAREAAQAADRRRRVRVALYAAERAVPRQHPAPFEEPPDMGRGAGQVFQPLWMATRPPRIGSALTSLKPAASIIFAKAAMSGKRSIDSIR